MQEQRSHAKIMRFTKTPKQILKCSMD